MFTPGPSSTLTFSALASRPSLFPISSMSSSSQLLAAAAAVGKQVAGMERLSPR